MMLEPLPHINAVLNCISTLFLIAGFIFIVKGRNGAHRTCMISAGVVSALFMVSYITLHTLKTYYFGFGPTKFLGEGLARPIYFTILTSHTILAALVAPFVVFIMYWALKGRLAGHKKIAQFVLPIWMYVSITGVIVYLMLYQLYKPA